MQEYIAFVPKSFLHSNSSPSAGVISSDPFTERYVLKDSERGLFGDVHFYEYKHNGLLVENYPSSRFVSGIAFIQTRAGAVSEFKNTTLIISLDLEYGAQSMPSFKLLRQFAPAREWHPQSALMVHRNHHGNGQQEMIEQIEVCFHASQWHLTSPLTR